MRSFQLGLKIVLLVSATTFSTSLKAQTLAGLALKNLERQKWQRAGELLSKALSKDSLNVTAKYVLAQYFFSEGNPEYHLDSAYHYALAAEDNYATLHIRQRERLKKFPLDSVLLVEQRSKIEEAAFTAAKSAGTEESFNHFINFYPAATALADATVLRDSVAYSTAAQLNTYESFQDFLVKYPTSRLAPAARENYERILYEVKTADQQLSSYERFLSEHPSTPYRRNIEQTIFEYRTAPGQHNDFIDFIHQYPSNAFVKRARDILFHLMSPARRSVDWPERFTNDSLRQVLDLDHRYLVPFLRDGQYGFMNENGVDVIPATFESLDDNYICGNIYEDVLALNNRLTGKNGVTIWKGDFSAIDDIGAGFLLLETGDCRIVLHKSGFTVGPPCVDDAQILDGRLIAIVQQDRWSLWTLGGRRLADNLHRVKSMKNVLILQRDKDIELTTFTELCHLPHRENIKATFVNSAETWSHNLILVRREDEFALLNQALQPVVPFKQQSLTSTLFGGVVRNDNGAAIFNPEGKTSEFYREIVTTKNWVAAKDSLWMLLDPLDLKISSGPYDSIAFSGLAAIASRNDSAYIFFPPKIRLGVKNVSDIEFIPATDSTWFLVVAVGKDKRVYNQNGQKLFTSTYDRLQYAGGDFLIGHKKEKKGLLSTSGKTILPPVYDAIGSLAKGKISLLQSMQFGLYDAVNNQLIKPAFDKNLVPYNNAYISANRGGLYGLVDWKSKPLTRFEFSEIEYWNDTTMLVKKNSRWMLYEIKTGNVILDEIKDIKYIRNQPDDKLAIVYAGTNHGVIHNHKGTIIPISFTDLVNVGSAEVPLYFTEKHVEEASIFVVIYYNQRGELLRKEIYDHADYDNIFCPGN